MRSETSRRNREERTSRETATAGYDIDHEVWDMAVAEQVHEALEALPDELRQPIELAYFGGHTYREVAEMLAPAGGNGEEPDPVGSGSPPYQSDRAGRATGRGGPVSTRTPEPKHREIQELLGVYALDAVDPETAAMVEATSAPTA